MSGLPVLVMCTSCVWKPRLWTDCTPAFLGSLAAARGHCLDRDTAWAPNGFIVAALQLLLLVANRGEVQVVDGSGQDT
jgi:hypothetical protein